MIFQKQAFFEKRLKFSHYGSKTQTTCQIKKNVHDNLEVESVFEKRLKFSHYGSKTQTTYQIKKNVHDNLEVESVFENNFIGI